MADGGGGQLPKPLQRIEPRKQSWTGSSLSAESPQGGDGAGGDGGGSAVVILGLALARVVASDLRDGGGGGMCLVRHPIVACAMSFTPASETKSQ